MDAGWSGPARTRLIGTGEQLLPDTLDLLDIEGRSGVIRLLIMIAAADGELLREEIVCIEAEMGRAMLTPEMRQDLRQLIANPPGIDEEFERLDQSVLRVGLRDGILLASADGLYHDAEVELIQRIATAAGISATQLDELYNWVHDGWKWMAKGRQHISAPMPGDGKLTR